MRKMWDRHEIIQLLSLSGTLTGLSITGLTIFKTLRAPSLVESVADDVLACSAFFFLLATYMFFFCLRNRNVQIAIYLENIADLTFLLALTGMKWLGPITPLGGVFLIAGWLTLFYAACKIKSTN